jgi:lipoprotein-anchoring transpeptidase ErfK/SrfK
MTFRLAIGACLMALALAGCQYQTVEATGKLSDRDTKFLAEAPNKIEIDQWQEKYRVSYNTTEKPGTVIVDTKKRHLYLVEPEGKAIRYRVAVGNEAFGWTGTSTVQRKSEWPGWTPPAEMLKRWPHLPSHMEGGPINPLGARALYLYQGNRDTLYRIHGTNSPDEIGEAVSSGCIRMHNEQVIDLYNRVPVGAKVIVM